MSKNKFDYISFPTDKPPTSISWGCEPKTVYLEIFRSMSPVELFVEKILTQLGHKVVLCPLELGDPVDDTPTHDPLNSYYLTSTCFVDPEVGICGAAGFRGHACLIDTEYPKSLTLANVRPADLPLVARAWQPTLLHALFWAIQHGCGSTRHGDDGEKHARGIAMVLNLQWQAWALADAELNHQLLYGDPNAEPSAYDSIVEQIVKPRRADDFEDAVRYGLTVLKSDKRPPTVVMPKHIKATVIPLPDRANNYNVDGYLVPKPAPELTLSPLADQRIHDHVTKAIRKRLEDGSMAVIRTDDGPIVAIANNNPTIGPMEPSQKDQDFIKAVEWSRQQYEQWMASWHRESYNIDGYLLPKPKPELLGLNADQIIEDEPHGNE